MLTWLLYVNEVGYVTETEDDAVCVNAPGEVPYETVGLLSCEKVFQDTR
jgi:hypothetical protein